MNGIYFGDRSIPCNPLSPSPLTGLQPQSNFCPTVLSLYFLFILTSLLLALSLSVCLSLVLSLILFSLLSFCHCLLSDSFSCANLPISLLHKGESISEPSQQISGISNLFLGGCADSALYPVTMLFEFLPSLCPSPQSLISH